VRPLPLAVLGLAFVVLAFRTASQLVYDDVSGWQLAGMTLAAAVGGAALWALLSGLARRAAGGGRPHVARELRVAVWIVAGLWTVPYVIALAHAVLRGPGTFDPWNGRLTIT
jgi:hypothetical protein